MDLPTHKMAVMKVRRHWSWWCPCCIRLVPYATFSIALRDAIEHLETEHRRALVLRA